MGKSPKANLDRINAIITAWETHRANKAFADLTLEQFREKMAPSLATRATIARLESELTATISQREMADAASLDIIQDVVKAVVADKTEGEDGEFYEALGYVRESERKSGLHRSAKTTETKPAA
jgi:hypothetical protein